MNIFNNLIQIFRFESIENCVLFCLFCFLYLAYIELKVLKVFNIRKKIDNIEY